MSSPLHMRLLCALERVAEDPAASEDASFREELLAAVIDVLGGDYARVAGDLHALAQRRTAQSDVALTPRESEVLALIAQGFTSKAVGERLSISPRTAESHRARLMLKLDARSSVELLAHAIARGLANLRTHRSE